eukprot:g29176.t1
MGKPRLAELPEPAIPEAEKLLGKQVFSHPHSAVFNAWLKRHRVNLEVPEVPDSDHWTLGRRMKAAWSGEGHVDVMVSGVERLTKQLGEKKFKEMIREVFLGGEERIQELTEWFTKKTNDGISFAIITAGVASTDRFFPTDLVLDLSGSRHQVLSVTGQKALMLRDLRPTATRRSEHRRSGTKKTGVARDEVPKHFQRAQLTGAKGQTAAVLVVVFQRSTPGPLMPGE